MLIFTLAANDPLRQAVDVIIAHILLIGAILLQQINKLQGTNYE